MAIRKNERAKACHYTKETQDLVWERDHGCCVLCGASNAMPNAHVISRAQGGLGVEQNIVCLGTAFSCNCHYLYDNCRDKEEKEAMYNQIVEYLKQHYPLWKREDMIYRKWDF